MSYSEYIDQNKVYEMITVRYVINMKNFGIGSIDGNNCVYIPNIIQKEITVGEIVLMNLIYKLSGKIHGSYAISTQKLNQLLHLYLFPKKMMILIFIWRSLWLINKMLKNDRKNGICIQKIMNDYVYNNNTDTFVRDGKNVKIESEKYSKINVNNESSYTIIDVWDKPNLRPDDCKFNVKKDFINKLYY